MPVGKKMVMITFIIKSSTLSSWLWRCLQGRSWILRGFKQRTINNSSLTISDSVSHDLNDDFFFLFYYFASSVKLCCLIMGLLALWSLQRQLVKTNLIYLFVADLVSLISCCAQSPQREKINRLFLFRKQG